MLCSQQLVFCRPCKLVYIKLFCDRFLTASMIISLNNPYLLNQTRILRCVSVVPLNPVEPLKAGPNAHCSLVCMSSSVAMGVQFLRARRASCAYGSRQKCERTRHIRRPILQTLSLCTHTIRRFPVSLPALHWRSNLSRLLAVLSTVIQT